MVVLIHVLAKWYLEITKYCTLYIHACIEFYYILQGNYTGTTCIYPYLS